MRKGFRIALAISMLLGATQVFGWNEGMWDQFALALKKLKYSIIPQTTNTLTLGDSSHYFLSAYITSLNTTNYVVADGGYVGLGAAKGRFVFDDETQDTISALTCDMIFGSATVDTGTITMIKGAQTSDPQVQFALSGDANGNFSITADTGDITLTAADDVFLTATGGALTIDAVNAAADSTVTITNSNGTYKADLSIEGAVSYDEADWTGGNVIYVPAGLTAAQLNTYIAAAQDGDTLQLGSAYTITAGITSAKQITLKGSSIGGTTITCATDSVVAFTGTVSNITLKDIAIVHTGNGTTRGIYFDGDISNCNIENVKITMSGTGTKIGFAYDEAEGIVRNVTTNLTSSDGIAENSFIIRAATAGAKTINLYGVHGIFSSISGAESGFHAEESSASQDMTVNLYDCTSTTTGASGGGRYAASAVGGANAIMNIHGGRYSGATADVRQATSGVLTLSNCTLANNTTSGTITRSGTVHTSGLNASGSIDWEGGNTIYVPVAAGTALQTACTAAQANDVLELGAGTYALTTNNLTPGKALTIRGKGVDSTLITFTTGQIVYSASNIKLENLTVENTETVAANYSLMYCNTDALVGIDMTNVKINISHGTGTTQIIGFNSTRPIAGTWKNVVMTSTSTAATARNLYFDLTGATGTSGVLNLYNCHFNSTTSGTNKAATPIINYGGATAGTMTINQYGGSAVASETGSSDGKAVYMRDGAYAVYNGYGVALSGTEYDAAQASTATLTLSNCTLANNTTSGTITYAGSTKSNNFIPKVRTITDTGNIAVTDGTVILNKSTAFTATLPASTGGGLIVKMKNIGAGTVTIARAGSDTIDGGTSKDLLTWESVTLCDYGAGTWAILE